MIKVILLGIAEDGSTKVILGADSDPQKVKGCFAGMTQEPPEEFLKVGLVRCSEVSWVKVSAMKSQLKTSKDRQKELDEINKAAKKAKAAAEKVKAEEKAAAKKAKDDRIEKIHSDRGTLKSVKKALDEDEKGIAADKASRLKFA